MIEGRINIVLPMAGGSETSANSPAYPRPLFEIRGLPMIQRVVDNLKTLGERARFIFIVLKQDCLKYHLDNTLRLIAGADCEIVALDKPTLGAACSVLMATKFINTSDPLVIANSDQVFECDLRNKMEQFAARKADAGCLYIRSVHPRWSYVRLEEGLVVEAAEKNPISDSAIAGFYYYKEGRTFVDAAQSMIFKEASVDGNYYVAPVFNEILLEDKRVVAIPVEEGGYYSFYTQRRIEDYETGLKSI